MVTLTLKRPVYGQLDLVLPMWDAGHVVTVLSSEDEVPLISFDSASNRVEVGLSSAHHFFGEKEVMVAVLKL